MVDSALAVLVARARIHPIVTGASVGLLWGAAMRAWMRFISPNPEFSWAGTLFILGASVIAGTLLGVAWWRRRAGGVGWWRLSALSLVLLGAGGAVMWPSVILGAIGFARPHPRWLRPMLLLAAAAVQIPVLQSVFRDNWRMTVTEMAAAIVWYAPMIALEAWAFSVAFAPRVEGAPAPAVVKRVVLAIPLVVVVGLAFLIIGLPGM